MAAITLLERAVENEGLPLWFTCRHVEILEEGGGLLKPSGKPYAPGYPRKLLSSSDVKNEASKTRNKKLLVSRIDPLTGERFYAFRKMLPEVLVED